MSPVPSEILMEVLHLTIPPPSCIDGAVERPVSWRWKAGYKLFLWGCSGGCFAQYLMALREGVWAGGHRGLCQGLVELKVCVSGAVLALQFCTHNDKALICFIFPWSPGQRERNGCGRPGLELLILWQQMKPWWALLSCWHWGNLAGVCGGLIPGNLAKMQQLSCCVRKHYLRYG